MKTNKQYTKRDKPIPPQERMKVGAMGTAHERAGVTYRALTAEQIEQEYPPEVVQRLQAKAQVPGQRPLFKDYR